MIKAFLKYSVLSIAIFFFLMGSSGINIINYCCNSCEEQGIEMVAEMSCETLHHDKQNREHESCCAHEENENDFACSDSSHSLNHGCQLFRAKVDVPIFQTSDNDSWFSPIVLDISLFASGILPIEGEIITLSQSVPPNSQFSSSGREILSQSSILRI